MSSSRPQQPRYSAQFNVDAEQVVTYYAAEAGIEVAERFVIALADTVARITDRPQSGSTRFAELSGIVGLRSLAVDSFPHLVFYLHDPQGTLLARLLHHRRDIPSLLQEVDEPG